MSTSLRYKKILITGAAGYLGGVLHRALQDVDVQVRLTDRTPPSYMLNANEEFVTANLGSLEQVRRAVGDVDAIVHLGAYPVEGPWDDILNANIVGAYNVFEASREAGVKRVLFASTHHVVGYYRRSKRVSEVDPPRPDSRYAASKVFGEALGRLYADKHGLSVICLRIGVARQKPPHRRALQAWLSEDDFVRAVLCSLQAEAVHFEVFYGVSANANSFWTDQSARFGYSPQSSAQLFERELLSQPNREGAIERLFQGGQYTEVEFDADPTSID